MAAKNYREAGINQQEIEALKGDYLKILTTDPNDHEDKIKGNRYEFFLSDKAYLRNGARMLFDSIGKIAGMPSRDLAIGPGRSGIKVDKSRGLTEMRGCIVTRLGPGYCLRIVETGLIQTADPKSLAERYDQVLASKRLEIIESLRQLSRRATPVAADYLRYARKQYLRFSTTPIETTDITAMELVEGIYYAPRLGVRIIRYLDGFQAYPVVHREGEYCLFDTRPLLTPTPLRIEELSLSMLFCMASSEFAKHTLYMLSNRLTRQLQTLIEQQSLT